MALAERFGVNRHTVARCDRGAGAGRRVCALSRAACTFIERRRRFSYPIGVRTSFLRPARTRRRIGAASCSATRLEAADERTAEALGHCRRGRRWCGWRRWPEADGRPVSRATIFFDAARFPGIEKAYAESGSITLALKSFGVPDYFRHSTLISARHASDARPRRSHACRPAPSCWRRSTSTSMRTVGRCNLPRRASPPISSNWPSTESRDGRRQSFENTASTASAVFGDDDVGLLARRGRAAARSRGCRPAAWRGR